MSVMIPVNMMCRPYPFASNIQRASTGQLTDLPLPLWQEASTIPKWVRTCSYCLIWAELPGVTEMRAKFLLALLLAAFPAAAGPPAAQEELLPRCGGPFQLCGYVERSSGALRIPQRFEVASRFSEGLAAVRVDGLYGYIDPTGKIVVAPRFQAAGSFLGGYAEVRLDDSSAIVDRSGRLLGPARFSRIIPFHKDIFVAEPLSRNRPSRPGSDVRLEGFYDLSPFLSMNGAGLYHFQKGWLTDQDLKFSIFDVPGRGLVWAGRKNDHGEEVWGLLKFDGTWQVTPRYWHVQQLTETHAVVASMPDYSLPPGKSRDAIRWGAVDRNGRLVVPLKFAHLSYWRGGYGYAMERKPYGSDGSASGTRTGIVRANGTLLADRYFDEVDILDDGTLPRGRLGEKWYSIDPSGRLLPDQLDGRPLVECAGGLSIIRRGGMVEFRRPGDGKAVGRFDTQYFHERACPGPFPAKRDGRWFIVLEDGSILGGENGFEDMHNFAGSHAAVQVEGKWGIIDRSGAFTVPPRFARLRHDAKGTFAVDEGAETFWINAIGEPVGKPVIARPAPERALTCEGGLRFFQRAGLWGLQDGNGTSVIEPRFRALSCFNEGISWAAAPGDNAWCPIGPDGRRRDAIECRKTFYPVVVTESHPETFSEDPYESSVLWTRAWLDYLAGSREEPPRWISRFGNGTSKAIPGQTDGAAAGTSAPMTYSVRGIGLTLAFLCAAAAAGWFWRQRAGP
jgi:hypothetical protein